MLNSMTVLIFDGSGYSSLDLSEAIEKSEGRVAGPVATLSETLTILDSLDVGGGSWIASFRTRPKSSCSSPSAMFAGHSNERPSATLTGRPKRERECPDAARGSTNSHRNLAGGGRQIGNASLE